jgi:WhiB family redox-sensing transcriptional regulator
MDSAYFFHPDGERGPARLRRENRAKAVCLACPVLEMCRKHALAVQEPYGIWGGMSEADRLNLLKMGKIDEVVIPRQSEENERTFVPVSHSA